VSLFVSGCRNHCKGCFQPETWDFDYGEPFTRETEDEIIAALRPTWIQGLSILGGEPMEPENQEILVPFVERVKAKLPDKDIWLYRGCGEGAGKAGLKHSQEKGKQEHGKNL
jgi:anaerobic ribonucleoside-triphosphate reductase activating protein